MSIKRLGMRVVHMRVRETTLLPRDVVVDVTRGVAVYVMRPMGVMGDRGRSIHLSWGRRCDLAVDGITCRKVVVRVREGRNRSSEGGDKNNSNFGRHDDFNCKVDSD